MIRIAIVSKPQKEELARLLPELIAWLGQRGYEALLDEESGKYTDAAPAVDRAELPNHSPALVIVLGGDGTLLSVARIFAATGTILSAAYALYLYRRMIFGALVKPALKTIQDLSLREVAILAPLVVITIALGFYPTVVTNVTTPSVAKLIHDNQTSLAMDHARGKVALVQKGAVQ